MYPFTRYLGVRPDVSGVDKVAVDVDGANDTDGIRGASTLRARVVELAHGSMIQESVKERRHNFLRLTQF